jgi:hypothetical protein
MVIGGGLMSALFAIGTVLIFVIGVPLGPWFLLASILLGTAVAVALYFWHKRNPVELTDLHHLNPSNGKSENS